MADKKSWINIQADTELVVMLDQMIVQGFFCKFDQVLPLKKKNELI